MKKAIVTTTINAPTKAIYKFVEIAKRDDWHIFIVGDQKTPHAAYKQLQLDNECVTYITPEMQEEASPLLSELIGWNCIQRRNFGFIWAFRAGAEVIATVDDDNIPYDNWGQYLSLGHKPLLAVYEADEIFDPFMGSNTQGLWHRGFPIQLMESRTRANRLRGSEKDLLRLKNTCLVQADFWDGEPDVDAVCRIAKGPFECRFDHDRFAGTAPGPFNSQNTFFHRDAFPHYFLFPHIGRMDDIWASYVLQALFPDSVVYGPASVYQERNPHDLSKDLAAEMIGYKETLNFCRAIFGKGYEKEGDITEHIEFFAGMKAAAAYREYKRCFEGDPK